MISKAIKLAVDAHEGQTDKAGAPYLFHPLRVMMDCETETERIIAVLHDVVENSAITFDDLRKEGFSERIISGIDYLSRRAEETYEDYITRVLEDETASRVKLADLRDNMNLCRLDRVDEDDWERYNRYKKAAARIIKKLYPHGVMPKM